MHRLRYHSTAPTAPPPLATSRSRSPLPAPPGTPARRPSRNGGPGRGAAVLLGVAIVALLAGGAVAATRAEPDAPASTADLTALAQRAALTQADFPAGWTADPSDGDNAREPEERALAECLGAPYDDSPYAADNSFSSDGLTATSDFTVAPSLEWAQADFATLLDGAAPGCFKKVITGMLGPEKPADASYNVDVTRLDTAPLVPSAVAGDATGFRATITLRQGNVTVPMTFDAIMVRHDRIEATVGFISVGEAAFPDDLRRSLTSAVVNRLAG